MEINKEQLHCDTVSMTSAEQTLRMILPLAGTDRKVLCGNARAYVVSCRVQGGEARAEGVVRGGVTLEGETPETSQAQQDFAVAVPAAENSAAAARARVTMCKCRMEGSSAVLEVTVQVCFFIASPVETEVITDIVSPDVQLLSTEAECSALVGIFTQRTAVRENIELSVRMPEVEQCLQVSPSVCINGVQADTDAVMVSGDVVLSVLYSGSDEYEPVAQVADRIPFSAVIEAPGVQPDDTVCLDISPEEGTVLPQDNEQGERRVLACDISLCCTACVSRKRSVKAVTAAYSTVDKTQCSFSNAELPGIECLVRRQSVRILLDAPQGAQPIARICAVNAYVQTLSTEAQSGTVRLMMRACFRVLYIASGTGELTGFDTYADFELNTDCSCTPASTVFACPDIDTLQAALAGSKCEIRMVLQLGLTVSSPGTLRVLTDFTATAPREKPCGLCIYIARSGETLFSVGEELGIAPQELAQQNPVLDEGAILESGTRITVYRRLRG